MKFTSATVPKMLVFFLPNSKKYFTFAKQFNKMQTICNRQTKNNKYVMEAQAINYSLMREAFKYSDNISSEKEIIEIALKEYVIRRKMKSIKDLKGKIHFRNDYNYKSMR